VRSPADHRPVVALVRLPISVTDQMAKAAVREEILRTLRPSLGAVAVRPVPRDVTVDQLVSSGQE
jgi:hypothetical protein